MMRGRAAKLRRCGAARQGNAGRRPTEHRLKLTSPSALLQALQQQLQRSSSLESVGASDQRVVSALAASVTVAPRVDGRVKEGVGHRRGRQAQSSAGGVQGEEPELAARSGRHPVMGGAMRDSLDWRVNQWLHSIRAPRPPHGWETAGAAFPPQKSTSLEIEAHRPVAPSTHLAAWVSRGLPFECFDQTKPWWSRCRSLRPAGRVRTP